MKDVGFCIVGLGMGVERAQQLMQTEGAKLAHIVDVNRDRAQEISERLGGVRWSTDLREALKDDAVEAVQVMTPSGTHAEIAIESLRAGKLTIVTKPLDVTLERCDLILDEARKTGTPLACDFQERYRVENQTLKRAADEGLLGKLLLGEARLKWYRDKSYFDHGSKWRGTWKMDGGGALTNQAIHVIDLLCWVMGRPSKVIGRTYRQHHNIEVEDLGMAMLEFPGGAAGTILGTTTYPKGTYWGIEVHGTEGAAHSSIGQGAEWRFLDAFADRRQQLKPLYPYRHIFDDVVSALRHGTPLACRGEQGRTVVEVISAIYESARNGGEPVEVAKFDAPAARPLPAGAAK
jgi:predicted dehydrogenase